MAPDRPLHESRARAERVVLARAVLRTPWRQLMREEGFKSLGAVQNCYKREMARRRMAPKDFADMTAQEIMERRDLTTRLAVMQLMEAKRAGDASGMAAMLREIRQNDVETAKMLGLYEPERVDLQVSTDAATIIDRFESELLALASRRHQAALGSGNVIDAEVLS